MNDCIYLKTSFSYWEPPEEWCSLHCDCDCENCNDYCASLPLEYDDYPNNADIDYEDYKLSFDFS